MLLMECPDDLRPTWKQFDGRWVFPNGSYIQLCGCNNKQFDNLRGNKSDLFILDEAAQIDELDTVVRSIALPQLLSSIHPNKRIILPSTPPTTPDHAFKRYAETAAGRGAYSVFDIYRSWYSLAEIDKLIEEMGGMSSTNVQRELFCKFVTDEALQIVPEWNNHPEWIKDVERNDYYKFWSIVEGLDIGYRDFTAWIGGYYDWNAAKLIITDEVALRENEFTTDEFVKRVAVIEEGWKKQGNTRRCRRIADNSNLNMLADLSRLHKMYFVPVSKKNGKEWMVNQLRQWVKAGKLIISPKCKMLIASLEFGIWKRGRDEFERSEELGHYDFIDALVYLVSGLLPSIVNINPIPPLYSLDVSKTMFPNGIPSNHANSMDDEWRKLIPKLF